MSATEYLDISGIGTFIEGTSSGLEIAMLVASLSLFPPHFLLSSTLSIVVSLSWWRMIVCCKSMRV